MYTLVLEDVRVDTAGERRRSQTTMGGDNQNAKAKTNYIMKNGSTCLFLRRFSFFDGVPDAKHNQSGHDDGSGVDYNNKELDGDDGDDKI